MSRSIAEMTFKSVCCTLMINSNLLRIMPKVPSLAESSSLSGFSSESAHSPPLWRGPLCQHRLKRTVHYI